MPFLFTDEPIVIHDSPPASPLFLCSNSFKVSINHNPPVCAPGICKIKKFTIPKKRTYRQELFHDVSLQSREFIADLQPIVLGSFWRADSVSNFKFIKAMLVHNEKLMKEFQEKRKDLRNLGRSDKELLDQYAFLYKHSLEEVKQLCRDGLQVKNCKDNWLGCPDMGVTLFRHADVIRPFPLTNNHRGFIVICKIIKGKIKQLVENCSHLEPTPNYDCHLSRYAISSNSSTSLKELYNNSQVYLYEYTDDGVGKKPRHIYPYGVVEFVYKGHSSIWKTEERKPTYSHKKISQGLNPKNCRKFWSGKLNFTMYVVEIELYYQFDYMKPVREGSVMKVVKQLPLNMMRDRYMKNMLSLSKKRECTANGRYLLYTEMCSKNEVMFSKIVSKLKDHRMAGVLGLELVTILLIPTCDITNELGISKSGYPANVLHCIFTSRQPMMNRLSIIQETLALLDRKDHRKSLSRSNSSNREHLKSVKRNHTSIPPIQNTTDDQLKATPRTNLSYSHVQDASSRALLIQVDNGSIKNPVDFSTFKSNPPSNAVSLLSPSNESISPVPVNTQKTTHIHKSFNHSTITANIKSVDLKPSLISKYHFDHLNRLNYSFSQENIDNLKYANLKPLLSQESKINKDPRKKDHLRINFLTTQSTINIAKDRDPRRNKNYIKASNSSEPISDSNYDKELQNRMDSPKKLNLSVEPIIDSAQEMKKYLNLSLQIKSKKDVKIKATKIGENITQFSGFKYLGLKDLDTKQNEILKINPEERIEKVENDSSITKRTKTTIQDFNSRLNQEHSHATNSVGSKVQEVTKYFIDKLMQNVGQITAKGIQESDKIKSTSNDKQEKHTTNIFYKTVDKIVKPINIHDEAENKKFIVSPVSFDSVNEILSNNLRGLIMQESILDEVADKTKTQKIQSTGSRNESLPKDLPKIINQLNFSSNTSNAIHKTVIPKSMLNEIQDEINSTKIISLDITPEITQLKNNETVPEETIEETICDVHPIKGKKCILVLKLLEELQKQISDGEQEMSVEAKKPESIIEEKDSDIFDIGEEILMETIEQQIHKGVVEQNISAETIDESTSGTSLGQQIHKRHVKQELLVKSIDNENTRVKFMEHQIPKSDVEELSLETIEDQSTSVKCMEQQMHEIDVEQELSWKSIEDKITSVKHMEQQILKNDMEQELSLESINDNESTNIKHLEQQIQKNQVEQELSLETMEYERTIVKYMEQQILNSDIEQELSLKIIDDDETIDDVKLMEQLIEENNVEQKLLLETIEDKSTSVNHMEQQILESDMEQELSQEIIADDEILDDNVKLMEQQIQKNDMEQELSLATLEDESPSVKHMEQHILKSDMEQELSLETLNENESIIVKLMEPQIQKNDVEQELSLVFIDDDESTNVKLMEQQIQESLGQEISMETKETASNFNFLTGEQPKVIYHEEKETSKDICDAEPITGQWKHTFDETASEKSREETNGEQPKVIYHEEKGKETSKDICDAEPIRGQQKHTVDETSEKSTEETNDMYDCQIVFDGIPKNDKIPALVLSKDSSSEYHTLELTDIASDKQTKEFDESKTKEIDFQAECEEVSEELSGKRLLKRPHEDDQLNDCPPAKKFQYSWEPFVETIFKIVHGLGAEEEMDNDELSILIRMKLNCPILKDEDKWRLVALPIKNASPDNDLDVMFLDDETKSIDFLYDASSEDGPSEKVAKSTNAFENNCKLASKTIQDLDIYSDLEFHALSNCSQSPESSKIENITTVCNSLGVNRDIFSLQEGIVSDNSVDLTKEDCSPKKIPRLKTGDENSPSNDSGSSTPVLDEPLDEPLLPEKMNSNSLQNHCRKKSKKCIRFSELECVQSDEIENDFMSSNDHSEHNNHKVVQSKPIPVLQKRKDKPTVSRFQFSANLIEIQLEGRKEPENSHLTKDDSSKYLSSVKESPTIENIVENISPPNCSSVCKDNSSSSSFNKRYCPQKFIPVNQPRPPTWIPPPNIHFPNNRVQNLNFIQSSHQQMFNHKQPPIFPNPQYSFEPYHFLRSHQLPSSQGLPTQNCLQIFSPQQHYINGQVNTSGQMFEQGMSPYGFKSFYPQMNQSTGNVPVGPWNIMCAPASL